MKVLTRVLHTQACVFASRIPCAPSPCGTPDTVKETTTPRQNIVFYIATRVEAIALKGSLANYGF